MPKKFPVQIAFNLIPQIDDFEDNGYTTEEMKLVWETRKILDDETIQVNPTAVRVPVFYGHSEAVHLETRSKIGAEQARALLEAAPGVEVVDERVAGGYPTPVTHAAGTRPGVRGPDPRGHLPSARPVPVDRFRQHPQGSGPERGADS